MTQMICNLSGYVYVLFFGEYVSIRIACGEMNARARRVFCGVSPLLLLIQGVLLLMTDVEAVRMLYPLIAHLPTIAALTLLLHAKWDAAVIAVTVSYSMCQLLRWVGLFSGMIISFPVLAAAVHILLSHLILLFLKSGCLHSLHDLLCGSSRMLRVFGAGLPILYYLYDYFLLYTRMYDVQNPVLNELLPTAMVTFYILFVCMYQREAQRHRQTRAQFAMLEMELTQAEREIDALRMVQEQTAMYRHDLRHHLRMIDNLLLAGKLPEAQTYIHGAEREIESIVPVRYCEHDTVNLLLGAFAAEAEKKGISIRIRASVPQTIGIPSTELCVLLSNGMENALRATGKMPGGTEKTIDFFCCIRQNNLLMEIQNPYCGELVMEKGVPVSEEQGHGFGCRSMAFIVQRRKGICSFETVGHVFFLRIAIPLTGHEGGQQIDSAIRDGNCPPDMV